MITNEMRVQIDFSHRLEDECHYLDIEIYQCLDTGVMTKMTVNLIDEVDIEAMIDELEEIKDKIIANR